MSGVVGAVLMVAYYSFPKRIQGIQYTAWGNWCMFIAGLGFGLRGIAPDWLSIVVANGIFTIGYWFMLAAVRSVKGLAPLPQKPALVGLLIFSLLITYWTYAEPSFDKRTILAAGVGLLHFIAQTITSWRTHQRMTDYFFTGLMVLGIAVAGTRVAGSAWQLLHNGADAGFFTPNTVQLIYLSGFILLSFLHALGFLLMVTQKQQNELVCQTHIDPLTGAYNRRALTEVLPQQLRKPDSTSVEVAVIICDLDHFKSINDAYGHEVGDQVLAHFAQLASELKRKNDMLVRMGGEEFALVLPESTRTQAMALAGRLHAALNQRQADLVPHYTASMGVYADTLNNNDLVNAASSIRELLRHTDTGTYLAKQRGRNRIEIVQFAA
ncbi:GGDEF domain-containing protein [Curvibacter sp. CHRR-16]|uniref:GGDEF domain-containing protein n=1 Tax=Curvibacter sp. CHRR-16 TaxID=2835872 RepID=UPI001BDAFE32|nr:GGDEF domain-containing protein [Curvibacter sp. CHRR-16]MBT0570916.1 GGDEF domain-containing protein [Curvibacter sp. CHRR-16]